MRLSLSDDLKLPLDVVTQKNAFLGRTGSGKTYGATHLAELMIDAGAQVLALDPVGVWWGLRLAANGKDPGISVPVFGGLHGDVPLEPTAGRLIADLVVDRSISAVIDVSQFEHDTDKARFSADFADRFFFRKKASPSAVHLFLEECQEFVPQNPQRGEERMLHAFQRAWRLGRNFGIGGSLISQRPQDVHKKALNQAECVFAFQLTGPHERKAVAGWMEEKGLDLDLAADLPKLAVGEAHVWSPAWLRISKTVRIAKKRTFNASSTPEVGTAARARELAPIDLDQIRVQMAATIERAKSEDPRTLRAEIAKLKAELAKKPAAAPTPKPERVEVPMMKERDLARLEAAADKCLALSTGIGELVDRLRRMGRAGLDTHTSVVQPGLYTTAPSQAGPVIGHGKPPRERVAPPAAQPTPASTNGQEKVGAAERAFLTVLEHRAGKRTDRNQLAVLAGYSSKSRHVDNTIGSLRTAGYVEGTRDDLRITAAGSAALGDVEPLPTGRDLIRYWVNEMGAAGGAMLQKLCDVYPRTMTRDQLAEATNYSPTSRHVDNTIGALRTRDLITGTRDALRAADELFS